MKKNNIVVSQAHAQFGDAALTLFRVEQAGEKPNSFLSGIPLIHTHLYYECHLLLHGKTTFQIGDRAVALCAHQLLIIPPMQDHLPFCADCTCQAEIEEHVLGLTLEAADGEGGFYSYFHAALMQAACTLIVLSDDLYDRINRFWSGFDGDGLRAQCRQMTEVYPLLFALFDTINGFQPSLQSVRDTNSGDIAVALDYFVNELCYTLSDIAQALGYSYRHTARLIRETYGDSLAGVRRGYMLSSAKVLLVKNPNLTLEQVARQSGFTSAQTMIRAFRVSMQMTPTEYRTQTLEHAPKDKKI
ncbi:MAG: AraC family transcriptional regulator [Clostridia bacterium]|nr:AraC family transcriptional regulator [Clostridia bacterium]